MDRSVAEFFAALVSTADLLNIEHWEKERLVSNVGKLDGMRDVVMSFADRFGSANSGVTQIGKAMEEHKTRRLKAARTTDKRFANSWRAGAVPYQWLLIWEVHPFAYRVINNLIDHGGADVRELAGKRLKPTTLQTNGVLAYEAAEWIVSGLFEKLWEAITTQPFSFQRCALCKTIFVPSSKKQKKYCSKQCSNKAVSLTPKRRAYMKDFMEGERLAIKIADIKNQLKDKNDRTTKEAKQLNQKLVELEKREKNLLQKQKKKEEAKSERK